jgi:N-acetylneuraminic acid mutarotase
MAAPPTGFTNRADHVAVWTGTEMLVWGGCTNANITLGIPRSDGARYNPANNSWTLMNSVNAPTGRALALGVWTGTELIVWGGYLTHTNNNSDLNTGGRYNPATDTWTPFNTGQYTWSQEATAVWTGSKVIWAGGISTGGGLVNRSGIGGITYDPATGIVGTLPVAPIQHINMIYTWTGTEMLTFGAREDALDRTVLSYKP